MHKNIVQKSFKKMCIEKGMIILFIEYAMYRDVHHNVNYCILGIFHLQQVSGFDKYNINKWFYDVRFRITIIEHLGLTEVFSSWTKMAQ